MASRSNNGAGGRREAACAAHTGPDNLKNLKNSKDAYIGLYISQNGYIYIYCEYLARFQHIWVAYLA